jgi:DNA-binding IclR family transcriptional regulator
MDNSIPALERAMAVLDTLYASRKGISALKLIELCGISQTTLYRILRLLLARGYVAQNSDGTYVLGATFVRMATRVPLRDDLAARALPVMHTLSERFGETIKLVVRDHLESVTTAVIHARTEPRITSRIGTRMPLYVGAPQRLLLSRAPQDVIEAVLSQPLQRWASGTITDPQSLRMNLTILARRDWELGCSESPEGIATVAALVHVDDSPANAAIALVFVEADKTEHQVRQMRDALRKAAGTLSTG